MASATVVAQFQPQSHPVVVTQIPAALTYSADWMWSEGQNRRPATQERIRLRRKRISTDLLPRILLFPSIHDYNRGPMSIYALANRGNSFCQESSVVSGFS